jgi:glycerol-3-phosphate dehydrogenase (NAD(P)+)
MKALITSRANSFLALPDPVRLVTDLDEALPADVMVIAAPAQHWRGLATLLAPKDLSRTDLVLCMKGLEKETGLRLSEVAADAGVRPGSISAWVGPGHPQQLVAGVPTCMLVASADEGASVRLAEVFGSRLIRLYRSKDIAGCEIGAAAKNVVGIAAGMLDGLGMAGLKGALMARAPLEVARLVSALGGDWRSVYGLSHLGDYEATLFSPYSRNRAWGEACAKGSVPAGLAEGVDTSEAMTLLGEACGVELPITLAVASVIRGESAPAQALERLFDRPSREEFPVSLGPACGCSG